MSQTVIGGWDTKDVSRAQYALVVRELMEDAARPVGPYAAFRWAMDAIGLEYGSLLDIGCGCGHYGVLCERFYPRIRYTGTDIAEAAIEHARGLAPLGWFSVYEFENNKFGDYDIVLASQILEMLDYPPSMLDMLLSQARQYVILNRIRLTLESSHSIKENTYCGVIGRNWIWNLKEITRMIEWRAEIIARHDWEGQCTFVVRRKND